MNNHRGFSLTDLMAGLAMSTILILLIGAVLSTVNRHFYETRERMAAEQAASRAEMLLKTVFAQAVNVQYKYTGNWNLAANPGQIYETAGGAFTFDQISSPPNTDWTILAAFNRETGLATAGIDHGTVQGTALYYRRPVAGATGTGTSGVIFISNGANGAALDAGYGGDFIDRVSYLSFQKHPHDLSNVIDVTASLDIHLRIRYHYIANGLTNWCPQADTQANLAGCDNKAPWNDIDRQFAVLLRNNLLHAGTAGFGSDAAVLSEERALGSLYFFLPVIPVK